MASPQCDTSLVSLVFWSLIPYAIKQGVPVQSFPDFMDNFINNFQILPSNLSLNRVCICIVSLSLSTQKRRGRSCCWFREQVMTCWVRSTALLGLK
jgi:hypothetical protein